MSKNDFGGDASTDERAVAEKMVNARLDARVLTEYPGDVPGDLASAYRIQDAAIELWPDRIGGWKVSMYLSPEYQAECGEERIVGPAFASNIRNAEKGEVVDCPVTPGGWPGVESEIVVRVGKDAPADKFNWTIAEASEMVGEMCIGVEMVSGALSDQLETTLATIVSDFTSNNGIIVGAPIHDWRDLKQVEASCLVNGEPAQKFPEGVIAIHDRAGPLGAFAYALGHCARRGHPLKNGNVIATGTITGGWIKLEPGERSRHIFEGFGEVLCHAVPAQPRRG